MKNWLIHIVMCIFLSIGLRSTTMCEAQTVKFNTDFEMPVGIDMPLVKIGLPGGEIGRFLVDSGTNFTAITDSMVEKLQLKQFPTPTTDGKPFQVAGSPAKSVAIPSGVKIGTLKITDLRFVVIKHKDLPVDVDGILGSDFLSVLTTLIDFKAHNIIFWAKGGPTPIEREMLGISNAATIPLEIDDTFHFRVKVRCNDEAEDELILDTGAIHSMLSSKLARKLQLTPILKNLHINVYGGSLTYDRVLLRKLEMGEVTIHDLIVDSFVDRSRQSSVLPSIGLDILTQYKVLIDAPNHKMYLKSMDANSLKSPVSQDKQQKEASIPPVASENQGKTYSWQLRLPANQTYSTLKTITISALSPSGAPHISLQTDHLEYLVKEILPNLQVHLEIQRKSTEQKLDGVRSPDDPSAYKSFTQTVTPQGVLIVDSRADGATKDPILQAVILTENLPVPERAVHIGEKWETSLANRVIAGTVVRLTSTLAGIEKLDEHSVYKVHVAMQIPLTAENAENTLAEDGFYFVRIDTGQIVRKQIVLSNLNISFPNGETLHGTLTIHEERVP